jgi:hypothetical protein
MDTALVYRVFPICLINLMLMGLISTFHFLPSLLLAVVAQLAQPRRLPRYDDELIGLAPLPAEASIHPCLFLFS